MEVVGERWRARERRKWAYCLLNKWKVKELKTQNFFFFPRILWIKRCQSCGGQGGLIYPDTLTALLRLRCSCLQVDAADASFLEPITLLLPLLQHPCSCCDITARLKALTPTPMAVYSFYFMNDSYLIFNLGLVQCQWGTGWDVSRPTVCPPPSLSIHPQ